MRIIFSYLLLTLKGICMGAADVIPGVSGGTIAFMTGIYEELINSIKSINLSALRLLLTGKFRSFWKTINGNFLLSVVTGIIISIFSLAKLMQFLLVNYPIEIWSFFFGLILSSTIFILRDIKGFKWYDAVTLALGIGTGALICLVSPSHTPDALWFIFLCGVIAICAMILPGISGSFILLLMGKYVFMMEAVSRFDLLTLLIFALGAIIGIISFSHLLSWLLKKFYNGTLFFLAGLMIGSLIKVWPWKTMLPSGVDRPVWPQAFNGNPMILQAVIWLIVGALLVFAIEFIAGKIKKA